MIAVAVIDLAESWAGSAALSALVGEMDGTGGTLAVVVDDRYEEEIRRFTEFGDRGAGTWLAELVEGMPVGGRIEVRVFTRDPHFQPTLRRVIDTMFERST
jgi:hypothetical protein